MTRTVRLRKWTTARILTAAFLLASVHVGQGQIAYVSREHNDGDGLYIINEDGTGRRRLIGNNAEFPNWSPDGSLIAITANPAGGNDTLFTIRPDGSEFKPVSRSPERKHSPAWSPDGTRMVYVGSWNNNPNLFILDLATDERERVTDFGNNQSPAWSPDGTQIAFASARNGDDYEIYVIHANGRETNGDRPKQLTRPRQGGKSRLSPAWSPDGKHIAFSAGGWDSPRHDIYVMDVNGGNIRRITDHPAGDEHPTWLRDGRGLVFSSWRDDDNAANLYRVDLDGQNLRLLSDHPWSDRLPHAFAPPMVRSVNPIEKHPFIWGWIKGFLQ